MKFNAASNWFVKWTVQADMKTNSPPYAAGGGAGT